jgi:hypothetical protein
MNSEIQVFPYNQTTVTQLIVRNSAWKNGALAVICLGFVLAWVSTLGGHSQQIETLWGGGLFFGLGFAFFGYRAFDRRPRLIVDESGINAPRASIGFVPWSEIRETRIRHLGKVDTVQVIPNDPAAWVGKLSPVQRVLWRWFPKSRVIRFQLQNMDVPTSAIAELITTLPAAKLAR